MSINEWVVSRRQLVALLGASAGTTVLPAWARTTEEIAPQPFFASVMRVIQTLADSGQSIARSDADSLAALAAKGDAEAVAAAEILLNRYTLARVTLDKDGIGSATLGGAKRELVEQGWRLFLLRISNGRNLTEKLEFAPDTLKPGKMSQANGEARALIPDTVEMAPGIEKMWLLVELAGEGVLSGLPVQYQIAQLFSRDHGQREAKLSFATAGEMPFVGWTIPKAYVPLLGDQATRFDFDCLPSHDVFLSIKDSDGVGCMASLTVRDGHEHVYPPQVMRIAPDMAFHSHIYRADGETLRLADGVYEVRFGRGPEYLTGKQQVTVAEGNRTITIGLRRWIDPAQWGWYSGDTHIHAAGCAHYVHPTEGVSPETMIRHIRGEALSIGSALNWGPSWYYQKQFFSGQAVSPQAALEHPDLQAANNASWQPKPTPRDKESLLRYDVEVSGFPSSLMGHLVLLRLKAQDYPGTKEIGDWPSWNLPIHKWAREQGALSGVAHCWGGMGTVSRELPNYEIPPFNSTGTNEAIVDVTHGYCDFLSGCEFVPAYEFNAWYHMLNCGFRLAMVGETDYPCFSGERPGMGRSYIQLGQRPTDEAGYDAWVQGIKLGKLYCGDGRSHFLKFAVNGVPLGSKDVELPRGGTVSIEALIAARLEPEPAKGIDQYYWHLELARIGASNAVPLELVVNGQPVERLEFIADGKPRSVRFKTRIERSSWVALRIVPSGHTHPIFVMVGGTPIRASRRSAEWLRECVDALWAEKHRLMRGSERPAAAEAYDHARQTYDRILAESDAA